MKLAEWFNNGCPYPNGVELYAELGTNNALKTMLGFGQNKFNARKLYAALEALQQTANLKKDQEVAIAKEQKEEDLNRDPQLAEWRRERKVLHILLGEVTTKEERYEHQTEILRLTKLVEQRMGIVPADHVTAPTLPTNPLDLMKARNNNRSYISKPKNHTNNPGEVQRRMEQNEQIDKLLGSE